MEARNGPETELSLRMKMNKEEEDKNYVQDSNEFSCES